MKKSLLFRSLFTSTMILSAITVPTVALADNYDEAIQQTSEAIEGMSAQQDALHAELSSLYSEIEAVYEEANEVLATISEDDELIEQLQNEIKELEDIIAKREELLSDQARAVQVSGGTTDYLKAIAAADSVSDFIGRIDVVRKMVSANKELLAGQKEDVKAVEMKKADVETARNAKLAKKAQLDGLATELQTAQANSQAVYDQLTNDITLAANQRAAIEQERQEFLAAQEAQAQAIAEQAQAQIEAEQQAIAQAQAEAAAQAELDAQAQAEVAELEAIAAEAEAVAALEAEAANLEAQAQMLEAQAQAQTQVEVAPVEVPEVTEADLEPLYEEQVTEVVAVDPQTGEETTTETVEVVEKERTQEEIEAALQEAQAQAEQEAQAQAELEAQAQADAAAQEVARQEAEAARQQAEAKKEEAAAAQESFGNKYGALISEAESHLGTPYVWGGRNPGGFDCSGFVQYVYNKVYGINVGSWTGEQQYAGTVIDVSSAQTGDLYFWGDLGSTYHVAIATGDGNYIHAADYGTPLTYGKVNSYFMPSFALRIPGVN